jgi:hypothetical protein
MLVYGDPQVTLSWGRALEHLAGLARGICPENLEALREFLIKAGQLEQAIADTPSLSVHAEACANLTRLAACLFCSRFLERISMDLPKDEVRAALTGIQDIIGKDTELPLKCPEGFEFYVLFPEQYCIAAAKWAANHPTSPDREVLVLGIRTIGTTLSAVVGETLRLHGWHPQRQTCRPKGSPYERQLSVSDLTLPCVCPVLVVDEGPGQSGSSMASVVRPLRSAGFLDITLFPGHAGMPGHAMSPETQKIWEVTPRIAIDSDQLRWGGNSLLEELRRRTQTILGTSEAVQLTDVSDGGWREKAGMPASAWPATNGLFERRKFLAESWDGQALIWKFTGLGGRRWHPGPLNTGSSVVNKPAILGSCMGFDAEEWVWGERLQPQAALDYSILSAIASHIASCAGPGLSQIEAIAARKRMAEIAYWNTYKGLGERQAEQVELLMRQFDDPVGVPRYGDGRVAPHEWVLEGDTLWKTDSGGHDMDHTAIGAQSFLWDVAGIIVEWHLPPARMHCFLGELAQHGLRFTPIELEAHLLGYLAFRLGMMRMAAEQTGNTAEVERRRHAAAWYQQLLEERLNRVASWFSVVEAQVDAAHPDAPVAKGQKRN